DRILLLAAGLALIADGSLPLWVGVVVLAREALISVAVLVLAAAGARRMDVRWAGKAGTLALMFALPGFLLADAISEIRVPLLVVTCVFTIGGLVLSYYAAVASIPQARAAPASRPGAPGVRMRYATEESPLGTAGSVLNASDELDDTFLVISGDVLTDIDLGAIVKAHQDAGALASIALKRVENPLEFAIVITRPDGSIER